MSLDDEKFNPLPAPPEKSLPAESRGFAWSLATLFIGVLALSAAVMFHLAFEQPKPQAKAPPPKPERIEGGIRLEWKGFKVRFGGKTAEPSEQPKAEPELAPPADALKRRQAYRMITAAIALIGLAAGPLACWRESAYALSGPGMAFCFLALTWQYIIAGIVIGVAVLVVLFILSALS
jgi:hypothetical protein